MIKDPVLACAIAVIGAMIMSVIKPVFPQVYWGVLITLLIHTLVRLKQNGFLWRRK
jgi:hypothetical protein|tara:strand:- start:11222 stop:11389 length:168 start_codon:yes stop_codon:yes gene_type:complete